uniref:Uncharacterized protein n=1 Tax=Avena sativa TaxID=4498 RepID=A0ACD5ZSJ7_AVESA
MPETMDKKNQEDDDDNEHTRLRGFIGVARYVIAALVAAITLAVIARAFAVSLRSEKLYIKVTNGTVLVLGFPANKVVLSVALSSSNPSGRVGISYRGVNVSLWQQDMSLITSFVIKDGITGINVGPDTAWLSNTVATQNVPGEVSPELVDTMRRRNLVDATVRLHGTLWTQVTGLTYKRGHTTVFSCYPVTIGLAAALPAPAGDVSCKEVSS